MRLFICSLILSVSSLTLIQTGEGIIQRQRRFVKKTIPFLADNYEGEQPLLVGLPAAGAGSAYPFVKHYHSYESNGRQGFPSQTYSHRPQASGQTFQGSRTNQYFYQHGFQQQKYPNQHGSQPVQYPNQRGSQPVQYPNQRGSQPVQYPNQRGSQPHQHPNQQNHRQHPYRSQENAHRNTKIYYPDNNYKASRNNLNHKDKHSNENNYKSGLVFSD